MTRLDLPVQDKEEEGHDSIFVVVVDPDVEHAAVLYAHLCKDFLKDVIIGIWIIQEPGSGRRM